MEYQPIVQSKGVALAKQIQEENLHIMRDQIKAYLNEEFDKSYPNNSNEIKAKIVQRLANYPVQEIKKYLSDQQNLHKLINEVGQSVQAEEKSRGGREGTLEDCLHEFTQILDDCHKATN